MSPVTTESVLSVPARVDQAHVAPRLSGMLLRIGSIAITLAVCLAMLEIGLRLLGRFQSTSTQGFLAQNGVSYGLKKNATTRVFWSTTSFVVHTDDYGFRADRPGPRDLASKPYYAVIGSSDAFGNGLDYDETLVGIFARRMAGHETEVLNLGVGGHHLIEQFARYKEFAARAPATPKTVVIILNPLLIHSFDDAHQNVVVRRGMLFEKDNWRLPLAKTILSSVSAAYSFFGHGVRNVQRRYFSRPDFSLDFYIRLYSKSTRIREPEVTAQFESRMIEFERFVRRQGATPTCVYSPTVGGFLLDKLQKEGRLDGAAFDTQFFRDLARRHCTSAGLQFVDFEPTLQQRYDRGEKLNLDLDAHFNEATSLALGEYLYRSLAGP